MPVIDYGLAQQGQQQTQAAGLQTGLLSQGQAMQQGGLQGALQGGQLPGAGLTGMAQPPAPPKAPTAASSIQDLADYLAKSYGVPLGRGSLVDPQGNFTRMPTSAEEAAKFNYIAQAIADQQNMQQQAKSVAALQTEAGLVQSRGRGSLATLQMGTYRGLAEQYNQLQFEADDFSYFIQEEFLRRQEAMVNKAAKQQKKAGRGALIGGILGAAVGTFVAPGLGTSAGFAIGSAIGGGAGGGGMF